MVRYENHLGRIDISNDFFINLVGAAVTNCFGVAGMATTNATQGFKNYLNSIPFFGKKGVPEKGIRIRYTKSKLIVDLHIIVTYGTNVSAVVKSIMNKVKYAIEEVSG
ncbi:MAG: hypothetical protein K0R90_1840 [Oscillospiraceae bacterium]|nr:hypothetical protein [Oscillospiraceae bacterium]